MTDITLKVYLILTIGYIRHGFIKCNEDASESSEVNDPNSLNSESDEAFNISSKENQIHQNEDTTEAVYEKVAVNSEKRTDVGVMRKVTVTTIPLKSLETYNGDKIKENREINKKSDHNYPYSVSVQRKSAHYTSGALVDKQWILTSGREFYNVRESIKIYRARLGSVNCKKGGILAPIKQVEVHPSYVHNRPAFDVALLRLGMPVEFDHFIAPIAITQTKGRVVSAKFFATYWPRLIVKGQLLPASAKERVKPNSMRVSTQQLIPWDECRVVMEHNNVTLEPSSQCLEPIVSHHSPCMPDAGAPVLAKDGLWGVTSGWTPKNCRRDQSRKTTIFTRLSSPRVHSWLQLLLVDL